jgi:ADP-heptose:LPS heptosyltransferase
VPKPQHIAVIRLSAMGDVAMTVPVIRALVLQYPDLKITMVSRPFFKPIFDTLPNVTFFEVDLDKRHKGFFGLLQLFSDLQKLEIYAIADLHNVLRSKVIRTLFQLSGKKVAFTDKGRAEKKALTRSKNKIFKPLKTMFERHQETFAKLGLQINLENPIFPEKAILSQQILNVTGIKNQKWIGIAPFAQYPTKVYPHDLMQQVIDALAANAQNKLFLFGGGKTETQLLTTFAQNKTNCIVIAGKLNLEQELQLISNLDVMLSMDSGNAHLAAMLGIKTITLWGATHPYAGFAPFGQDLSNCLLPDLNKYPLLPSSVYGNKHVVGYEEVMRGILPETVVAKVMT